MRLHKIELAGYCAKSPDWPALYLGTAGSYGNEQLAVTLGKGWEGLTVTATFQPAGVTVLVPDDGVLDVPWEATETALAAAKGRIVFEGVTDGRVLISTDIPYAVGSHSDTEGSNSQPPTPSQWQQFVDEVKGDADRAEQAAKDAEASVQNVKDDADRAEQAAKDAEASVQNVKDAGAQAVKEIETANAHSPQINSATGYWQTWDAETGQYVDTTTKAQGETPQLTIGTVTTLDPDEDATVTITGTAEAPVLNFGIPKGEQGDGSTSGSDLPATTAADSGKAPTVNAAGTGYELTGPYAPLSAAIIETAKGNPAVCEDSVEWGLQGMRVYGKSTQASTTGAQLFDISTVTADHWFAVDTGEIEKTVGYSNSDYIPVSPGNYVCGKKGSARTVLYNAEKVFVRYVAWGGEIPLTVNDGEAFVRFTIKTSDGDSYIDNLMFTAGSTIQPFEPYTGGKPSPSPEYPQEIVSAGDDGEITITLSDNGEQSQSLTFSTPDGLPGIPVDSGGNFVDADGQEWVCNYRDWARGVDVKNVAALVYNSDDENSLGLYWNNHREEQLSYGCVCFSVFYNRGIQISATSGLISSHFTINSNVTSGVAGEPGIMAAANRIYCRILLSTIEATASDDDSTLLQAVRNWINTQLTLGTPVTAITKITSPIETPIPADELATYRALHTYDGTTVITPNDALVEAEVDYIVKPKAYIEKKLTAIEQKIQEVAAAQINTQTGG